MLKVCLTFHVFQALTMDMSGNGLCFDNLWAGPGLSFGNTLIFLCFDNFLYAILAYYLDLVIPSEYIFITNIPSNCIRFL